MEDESKSRVVGEVPCKSHSAAGGCVGADGRQAAVVSGGSLNPALTTATGPGMKPRLA